MNTNDVEISKIEVLGNSRLDDDQREKELTSLMDSIKQHGLQQAIGVKKVGVKYVLVFGGRRLSACRKLGWQTIPANILDGSELKTEADVMILNLVENEQRKDISVFELGRYVVELTKLGLNLGEISARLGIARSTLDTAYNLVVSRLPEDLIKDVVLGRGGKNLKGKMALSTAKYLGKVAKRVNIEDLRTLLKEAKARELTGNAVKRIAYLISRGLNVNDALKDYESYISIRTDIVMRREKWTILRTEYKGKPINWVLSRMLNGKIPTPVKMIIEAE